MCYFVLQMREMISGGVQLYGMIGMHGLLRTDPRDIPDPWYGYQVRHIYSFRTFKSFRFREAKLKTFC